MALPRVRGAALLAIAALVGLIVSLVLIYTVERRAAVTTVPVLVVTKSVAKEVASRGITVNDAFSTTIFPPTSTERPWTCSTH